MCKRSDTFSLAVLIGRGLEPFSTWYSGFSNLHITFCFVRFLGCNPKELYRLIRLFLFCSVLRQVFFNNAVC